MATRDARFELKQLTDTGTFAGLASVYNVLDFYDEIITSGAFGESIAEQKAKGRMPAMLWQHNARQPIGVYTMVREDPEALYVEGKLALATQQGAEAYELMKLGALSGLSVGFQTREDSVDQKTWVRTIKKADLWEVSPVTFPANDEARIQGVKAISLINSIRSAERHLRDSGAFSHGEATAFVARLKAVLQGEPASGEELQRLEAALKGRQALFP